MAGSLDTFDRRKLLLDEPASGLINSEIDELDLIICRLVDEYHIAAILIEHRLDLLSAIADRAVVLDMGAIIATGTPRAWRERKQRREMVYDIFPPLRKLEHALVGQLSGGERRMVSSQ